MTYEEALYHAKSGKALLFYGSGMAYDVLNMRDEKMPTGAALSHILCKESGFKEEQHHDDLEHSSQEYIEIKGDISLIKLLKEVFKTKKLPNYYAEISKTPWKSIFTTNYDNSLEISSINNGIHRNSIDLTFDPKKFPPSTENIIHINGYIESLNQNNLYSSFKLTKQSYLADQFIKNIWYKFFYTEVLASKAIFFIGYSLKSDFDIAKLFFDFNNDLKEKTFFITQKENRILDKYGTVVPIGVDKFAEDLSKIPVSISQADEYIITNFERYQKTESTPGTNISESTFKFLTIGQENQKLLEEVVLEGLEDFAINRQNTHYDLVKDFTYIFIHGDLGVGKSILAKQISISFYKNGYDIFFLKDDYYNYFDDIEYIISSTKSTKSKVLFILDLNSYSIEEYNLITAICNKIKLVEAKLIITMRDNNYDDMYSDLVFKNKVISSKEITEINASQLSEIEFESFIKILDRNALLSNNDLEEIYPNLISSSGVKNLIQHIKHDSRKQLNHLLLSLFNSDVISGKYNSIFESISKEREILEIIVCVFALNIIGKRGIEKQLIFQLTNNNLIISSQLRHNAILKTFFFNNEGEFISPKSSLFSEFFFKKFKDSNLMIDILVQFAKKLYDLKYYKYYKSIATYANIQKMLPEERRRTSIIKFYEGIKTIQRERENPHFWLQFAIARLAYAEIETYPHLDLAKNYLDKCFELAKKRKNYTTYDFTTQLARFHILKAKSTPKEDIENIKNNIDIAINYLEHVTLKDPKRASFQQIKHLCEVIDKNLSIFKKDDLLALLNKFIIRIDSAPYSVQEEKGVRFSRERLQKLLETLEKSI